MDRRTFVGAVAAGLLGAPRAPMAQQLPRVFRIALLGVSTATGYSRQAEAFRRGLSEHGYVEGRNIVLDQRWADGDVARLPGLAAELIRLGPDVIVTSGPAAAVAKRATDVIPIVMTAGFDPVATGLVASHARPGGNLTGASIFFGELVAKRVQIAKEALPRVARVGVLLVRGTPAGATLRQAMDEASRQVGVAVEPVEVRDTGELGAAFAAMAGSGIGALVVGDNTIFVSEAARVATLANARRLPSIGFVEYAAAGGLFAYGVDFPDLWHRAAETEDRILKGTKPADLPIQRPTRFEFVVNLKTAGSLGVAVPPALLQRADHVIR